MIICIGVLPWIVLDLLQWKTQCSITYIRSGFVIHYFPVESQNLHLSRPGFVNIQNWKNGIKKLNITFMLHFFNLFKIRYNTCQIHKKKNTQICLKRIKIVIKTIGHSQNILHVDVLYNINGKKYKTVCAELSIVKVTFDRMVMIFYKSCNVFLFAMELDYCNIQWVFDQ